MSSLRAGCLSTGVTPGEAVLLMPLLGVLVGKNAPIRIVIVSQSGM